jgi:hypothetical protein
VDALVVLFPKSGGAWLSAMTSHLGFEIEYTHLGSGHIRRRPYRDLSRGRIASAQRLVGLFRDPRDLVVAGYHQCRFRARIFNGSMRQFIVHPNHGIEKISRFHLALAAACAAHPRSKTVTYEAMHGDAASVLVDLAAFLGRPISIAEAQAAAAANTFPQMQQRERADSASEDVDMIRTRRGVVGSYRDELGGPDIDLCNEILGRHDYWSRLSDLLRGSHLDAAS